MRKYAKGKVWSRVIWDAAAVGWLLNDDHRLMLDGLVPAPVPEYDHHYSQDPTRPLCRMIYHIYRDALLADLFRHIQGDTGSLDAPHQI